MDIVIDTLNQLLPTLLIIWLPIEDLTTRSVLSLSLSKLITTMIKNIYNAIKYLLKFIPINKFFRKNYIKINQNMIQYDNLLQYISENYVQNIVGFNAYHDEDNDIKYRIEEIDKLCLKDTYNYENIQYDIFLYTDKSVIDSDNNNNNNNYNYNNNEKNNYSKVSSEIIIKSVCNTDVLKKYIEHIHYMMNEKTTNKNNALKIYRTNFTKNKGGKNDFTHWKKFICLTNKTLTNTIVSKSVKIGFINSIEKFITSEEEYKIKGLPYKIGFLLYGEPGCGKTSIVKAIAQYYNIPIFVVDMDMMKNNDTMTKVMNTINQYVTSGKLHIVLFEDIDRCSMFNYRRTDVTENSFLNILDGVDETHGRINILTVNNIKKINYDSAFIRPGRIDKIIQITFCNFDQIVRTMRLFFEESLVNQNI